MFNIRFISKFLQGSATGPLQIEGPNMSNENKEENSGSEKVYTSREELIKATTIRRGGGVLMLGELIFSISLFIELWLRVI